MFDNIGKVINPKYVIEFKILILYDFYMFFLNKERAVDRVRDIVDKY